MKKQILKITVLFAICCFLMVSCEKDSSVKGELHQNKMAFDGVGHDLSNANLEYYVQLDDDPAVYGVYLFITSSSVNIDYTGFPPIYTGRGEGIYFVILSSSPTELVQGTYVFNNSGGYTPNTIISANMFINFNWEDFGKKSSIDAPILYGTLEVNRSGDEYIFKLDCILSNYEKFKAYFKGTVDYHDFSGMIFK